MIKKAQEDSRWLKEAKKVSIRLKNAQEVSRRLKKVEGYLIDGHHMIQEVLIRVGIKLRRLLKVCFFYRLDSLLINCRSFQVPTKALIFSDIKDKSHIQNVCPHF